MPNDYSLKSAARRKAIKLNAQDANVLVQTSLSIVFSYLSAKQMVQIQKVLDAAVVNPAIKKEQEELYQFIQIYYFKLLFLLSYKTCIYPP